nr:HNH endonuclease [uncultured Roseateles sp.]
MGQEVVKAEARNKGEIASLEGKLKDLTSSKEWEIAQAGVDAAGVVDPTPISDGISAVMSVAKGDWIGAGLSAVSMIPYLGDAVAKTAKGARAIKKLKELTESISDVMKRLDALKKNPFKSKKDAAEAVRNARKKAEDACAGCKPHEKYGVHGLPQSKPPKQEWRNGTPGDGTFVRQTPKGELQVPYENGYPNYDKATLGGKPVVASNVEIPHMNGSQGPDGADFKAAAEEMRKSSGNKHWPGANATDSQAGQSVPDGYTWHHKEDGVTMQLIPKEAHTGVSHTGGASIVTDPKF